MPEVSTFERVPPHRLTWRQHPGLGGLVAAVAIPLEEAASAEERGWFSIEGQHAVISHRLPDEVHNAAFRIVFERPWRWPHP